MEKYRNKKTEVPNISKSVGDTTQQVEDAAMKTVMHFFADELLPYFGIQGKVSRIVPTELVHLEVKKLFEDFNLEMEDGSWIHFEFQSTNEGLKGLKRFRTYEALASYLYNVSVTTYVLFSGNIQHPMTQFTEGINTYRVHPIIMRKKNADDLIEKIQGMIRTGSPITKSDFIPLILSPLMSGQSSLSERFRFTFRAVKQTGAFSLNEIQKMEAVIYAMAEKFLDKINLEEMRKEIRMTRLGQMMVEEGIQIGIQKGENRLNHLIQLLIQANRMDDIIKAANEKEYRDQLYKEFNL